MRRLAISLALALAACPPPSAADFYDSLTGGASSSAGSTTGSSSTGSTGGDTTGTTGEESSSTGTTGADSTGGEPLPEIDHVELAPNPIEAAGPIAVAVDASDADAVTMAIDGAAAVPLTEQGVGHFVGEIAVYGANYNGSHSATFTPSRGPLIGEPVSRPFTATLPAGGTEIRWEVSGDLAEALGESVAIGPDGSFYEFGTLDPGGEPRCYARRRGPNGEYGLDDVLAPVLPDQLCRAKKIALDATGRIFMLAEVDQGGTTRWWLGSKQSWASPPDNLMFGELDATASALALDDRGRVAVCGAVKTLYGDRDAFVQVYDPQGQGFSRKFDFLYDPDKDPVHKFSELAHDCLIVGEVFVFAGELYGQHPNDIQMNRSRHMVLEFDEDADELAWNIADKGPGPYVQSGARAIADDGGDGYVTAGYVCGEPCVPQLYLRQFLAGTEYVDSFMPAVKTTVPTDIAYSPAGYVVVTAARIKGGWWTDFWAQAWELGAEQELWSYARSDAMTTHFAQGVAIGEYGRIHLVGTAQQAGLYRPVVVLLQP